MGVKRTVEDPVQALGSLRKQFDDYTSTANARITSRPTGTMEPTFATTAKAGTLLCNGQAVSRTTYPLLWQWVQDSGALASGAFGVGNGSTTFTVPNLTGKVTTVGSSVPLNFLIWT